LKGSTSLHILSERRPNLQILRVVGKSIKCSELMIYYWSSK